MFPDDDACKALEKAFDDAGAQERRSSGTYESGTVPKEYAQSLAELLVEIAKNYGITGASYGRSY
jgi:hypothetical protein